MKGTLYKNETTGEWMVRHVMVSPIVGPCGFLDLRLHPDSVKEMEEDEKIFDNLEARVAAYPEVEFEVHTIATGTSEKDVMDEDVAKLIRNTQTNDTEGEVFHQSND
jgi:hypothetical protein